MSVKWPKMPFEVYEHKSKWKFYIALVGGLIIGASLWYSNSFARELAREEREKVELWAKAIRDKAKLLEYTNKLFTKISAEEREKVIIWSKAIQRIIESTQIDPFVLEIIERNNSVPIVLMDDAGNVLDSRNLNTEQLTDFQSNTSKAIADFTAYPPIEVEMPFGKQLLYYKDSKLFEELKSALSEYIESFITEVSVNSAAAPTILVNQDGRIIRYGNIDSTDISEQNVEATLDRMRSNNTPIEVDFGNGEKQFVYYDDSRLLKQIYYFPYVQLGIMTLFVCIGYWAFSNARKGEQNKVWVGLAKETAHQLGTPISSLAAWIDLLRVNQVPEDMLVEMEKDISRLEIVTDRFSKIGSMPKLHAENFEQFITDAYTYMRVRKSKLVEFSIDNQQLTDEKVMISGPLMHWVIENLVNNAIDAMEGKGKLHFEMFKTRTTVGVRIQDTGSGIPKQHWKTVFKPGYSTKKRGWGLGLSLAKRIVQEFHTGKISIEDSKPGEGTRFCIELPLVPSTDTEIKP